MWHFIIFLIHTPISFFHNHCPSLSLPDEYQFPRLTCSFSPETTKKTRMSKFYRTIINTIHIAFFHDYIFFFFAYIFFHVITKVSHTKNIHVHALQLFARLIYLSQYIVCITLGVFSETVEKL